MSVSINGTSGLVFNDASTQATAATGFGFKNRIINGAMMIDQRNAGASISVPAGQNGYPVDRFYMENNLSGTVTAQRSTDAPAGFINSISHTVSTTDTPASGDYIFDSTSIEGLNMADLGWGTANAQTVTLSFWVKSSITGTYGIGLRNSAGNRSYVATYTVNASNTWEQKTVTIAGDTSGTWLTTNGLGVRIFWDLGSGSNFNGTAGSWNAGSFWRTGSCVNWISNSGATFYITGVQLEKGSTATSFDWRAYASELALCQRYFETSYAPGTAIGVATSTNGTYSASTGGLRTGWHIPYAVSKRANPTTTVWDFAGTSGRTTQCDATTGARTNGANNIATNSGGTAAIELEIGITSSCYYAVQWASSSEL